MAVPIWCTVNAMGRRKALAAISAVCGWPASRMALDSIGSANSPFLMPEYRPEMSTARRSSAWSSRMREIIAR